MVFEISKVLVSPRNSQHSTRVNDKNSKPKSAQNEMGKKERNKKIEIDGEKLCVFNGCQVKREEIERN